MNLTTEERDALLAADLRNVTEKVAAGAVLSSRERDLIAKSTKPDVEREKSNGGDFPSPIPRENWPQYAPSLDELAGILGKSERAWRTYSKRPGFPGKIVGLGYDVAAVSAWAVENIKQQATGDLAAEKIAKTKLEVELLELKVAREKRLSVLRSEVDELHGRMGMKLRSMLYACLVSEMPPKCAGFDALALRQYGQSLADEIVRTLQRDVDQWSES